MTSTDPSPSNPPGRPALRARLAGAMLAVGLIAGGALAETAVQAAPTSSVAIHFYQGRQYCWYDHAWNGPGWYWCGYDWRYGRGWGGEYGWRGWPGGFPYLGHHHHHHYPPHHPPGGPKPGPGKPGGGQPGKPPADPPGGGKPPVGHPGGGHSGGGKGWPR